MAASFLVGLRVEGRRCVVIGDDDDAANRASALADAGARVERISHGADASDLRGAFLVVSTPRDAELSRRLFAQATSGESGFLLCCVDQPDYCTFAHVGIVRRGPLQIAVATDGEAPAVAAAIRRAFDAQLGADLARWVTEVAAVRSRTPPEARSEALRRALEGFSWTVAYALPPAAKDG